MLGFFPLGNLIVGEVGGVLYLLLKKWVENQRNNADNDVHRAYCTEMLQSCGAVCGKALRSLHPAPSRCLQLDMALQMC